MNGGRRACPRANLRRFLYRHKQHSGKVGSLPQRPPPSPAPHPTQAWGTVGLLRGPNCLPRSPPPQLSHASCFAPPSGKKAAGHPVPTLTLHASQRESAHCTAGKHLCHLPQRPLRGQNLSGCPAIHPEGQPDRACPPPPSLPRAKPGKHAAKKRLSAPLVPPILLRAESSQQSQRPRSRDPTKPAQSTAVTTCKVKPLTPRHRRGTCQANKGGYGVGTAGLRGRAACEAEEVQGACPGPLHRASPHGPASPPGNEQLETLDNEGCNLYISPE